MRKGLIFSVILFLSISIQSQNVYEIYCNAYAKGRELKEVNYLLLLNGVTAIEQLSKTGKFQFVVLQGEGNYTLRASKEGYNTKVIEFHSGAYPFSNEYEIQDIAMTFNKKEGEEDIVEIGELKWISSAQSFSVVKVDTTMEEAKKNFAQSEKTLDQAYLKAIENGDELASLNEVGYAIGYFELALLIKPEDPYAKKRINELRAVAVEKKEEETAQTQVDQEILDKINKGELQHVDAPSSDGLTKYSIQLGAFSKQVDESKFSNVPDFLMIPYEDFTRCFSGQFSDVNDAIQRKNEMVSMGYKDAWIVQMKGNERIGF